MTEPGRTEADSWLELFFDLVVVAAVAVLADGFLEDQSPRAIGLVVMPPNCSIGAEPSTRPVYRMEPETLKRTTRNAPTNQFACASWCSGIEALMTHPAQPDGPVPDGRLRALLLLVPQAWLTGYRPDRVRSERSRRGGPGRPRTGRRRPPPP